MKLLILTQKVDKEDPVLGFFHSWILELSKNSEKISVICLEKGNFDLPRNVEVFSLGKESGRSKIKYLKNFFNLIIGLHREYNSVFVHMNQEYILLGGFIWKIMGKKVFMWRNHHAGSILTDIAALFCKKVFCTSKFSYTAKYKKTEFMPVGIDTSVFNTELRIKNYELSKNKILFLSRMSPIKRPELLIEALGILNKKNIGFVCDFYGDSLPKDEDYYNSLKNKSAETGLNKQINFYKGVPNYETPKIYSEHDIFVNLSSSGMYDKTIFEAMACGCLILASNDNLRGQIGDEFVFKQENVEELAIKLKKMLEYTEDQRTDAVKELKNFAEKHSLKALIDKLVKIFAL